VSHALKFLQKIFGASVFQRSDCDYCGQWFDYEDRKLFCSPQCKRDYAGATNNAKRFNLTVEKKAAWEKRKFEEAV
jgi:hypothetical protein